MIIISPSLSLLLLTYFYTFIFWLLVHTGIIICATQEASSKLDTAHWTGNKLKILKPVLVLTLLYILISQVKSNTTTNKQPTSTPTLDRVRDEQQVTSTLLCLIFFAQFINIATFLSNLRIRSLNLNYKWPLTILHLSNICHYRWTLWKGNLEALARQAQLRVSRNPALERYCIWRATEFDYN